MQKIDGQWYVSVSHWGMHKVGKFYWEAESDDFESIPFEMDMQRAANMLKSMKEIKASGNRLG